MKEKIRTISFAILLITIFIFNIIKADKVFSSKENRYLQKRPEIKSSDIISGKFAEDFEKYSTDQFILRDRWISLKTVSDLAMLKKDNSRVYFGKDDYLFDMDEKVDKRQFAKNIDYINEFLDGIKKDHQDIDVYAFLVPSKPQVLEDKLPVYAPIVDEKEILEILERSLRDNIGIMSPIDKFKSKSNEFIYYRTDHHWTSDGAFYAYEYFLEMRNERPLSKEDFRIENVSRDFLGTSYRKANYYPRIPDSIDVYMPKDKVEYDITINKEDKDDSLYDESYLDKTDKYSYFLGGDKAIVDIETSIENHKTVLVIKDSFANSFVPFLANHYKRIIVIDPRYFNIKILDYIGGEDIGEILFLFGTQNFIREKSLSILSK